MPKRRTSDVHFIELTQEINVEKLRTSIQANFSNFPDPRRGGNIVYSAWYLIFVILCGYLAGGNTIEDFAWYLRRKAYLSSIRNITGLPIAVMKDTKQL